MFKAVKEIVSLAVSGLGIGFWVMVWLSLVAVIKIAVEIKDGHTEHIYALLIVLSVSWAATVLLGIRNRRRGCQRESGARILDFETGKERYESEQGQQAS